MSKPEKKRKKGKAGRKTTKPSAKKLRRSAIYEHAPATVALAELFAVCDDVFTEEDAFSNEHIKKSLGRIHREWKKTRGKLDPDFDPKRYPKRPRRATEQPISSMGLKLTSGSNPKTRKKPGKQSRKKSAKGAR